MKNNATSRDDAVREQLIDYVTAHPARLRRPRLWAPALLLTGAIIGGGAATSAYAITGVLTPGPAQPSGQPEANLPEAVTAPAGVIPGSAITALVGEPISVSFTHDTTIPLPGDSLGGATHARVTITALSTGDVSFGTDAAGNNPSAAWTSAAEVAAGSATAQYDFPLDDSVSTIYLQPHDLAGIATVQLITQIPTRFGVNARGQSFGITGSPLGEPDLIAVVATNGASGYVVRLDLENANGTTAAEQFTSPEEAVAEQQSETARISLPVYESDGTTVIGEYEVVPRS